MEIPRGTGLFFSRQNFANRNAERFAEIGKYIRAGEAFHVRVFPYGAGGYARLFLRDRAVRDGFPHPLPDFLYPDRVKIIAQCAFFT